MASVLNREQLLEEIALECDILKHLYAKIPVGGFDYRPTPGQRSMLEVLQYVSATGAAALYGIVRGDIRLATEIIDRNAEMPAENFIAELDRQMSDIREMLDGISDDDFQAKTAVYFTGESIPYGRMIVKSTLKWLTAYRMQVFLYLKELGVEGIGTLNNWVGIDMPAAQPAEA